MNTNGKYFYTATLMSEALLALLEKKNFEFITIKELTQKAGVNRSTFYLHYDTLEDLLQETIERLNDEFLKYFTTLPKPTINSPKNAFLISEDYLLPYLDFVKNNKKVFIVAHKNPKLFNTEKVYKSMYQTIFLPAIEQFCVPEDRKIFVLEFFTKGVVGIIHKWIEQNCEIPAKDLIKIIIDCIRYKL